MYAIYIIDHVLFKKIVIDHVYFLFNEFKKNTFLLTIVSERCTSYLHRLGGRYNFIYFTKREAYIFKSHRTQIYN